MTVKVPTTGNPLVRELFQAINDQHRKLNDIAKLAGVWPQTVRNWRRRPPKLDGFEAMLDTLGLELVILPKSKPFTED